MSILFTVLALIVLAIIFGCALLMAFVICPLVIAGVIAGVHYLVTDGSPWLIPFITGIIMVYLLFKGK